MIKGELNRRFPYVRFVLYDGNSRNYHDYNHFCSLFGLLQIGSPLLKMVSNPSFMAIPFAPVFITLQKIPWKIKKC